ncbi:MAG: carbon storage regulator [Mariprofundaceae bacterium]
MILRRKAGEAIRIGEHVRLVIQQVQNGHVVRFGIEAPEDIPIHRLEIYELIQQENKAAAAGGEALTWLMQEGGEKHD